MKEIAIGFDILPIGRENGTTFVSRSKIIEMHKQSRREIAIENHCPNVILELISEVKISFTTHSKTV